MQKNTGQNAGKARLDLNVEAAWAIGVTGKNVTVAIMDDGVDYMHPDIINNYVCIVTVIKLKKRSILHVVSRFAKFARCETKLKNFCQTKQDSLFSFCIKPELFLEK